MSAVPITAWPSTLVVVAYEQHRARGKANGCCVHPPSQAPPRWMAVYYDSRSAPSLCSSSPPHHAHPLPRALDGLDALGHARAARHGLSQRVVGALLPPQHQGGLLDRPARDALLLLGVEAIPRAVYQALQVEEVCGATLDLVVLEALDKNSAEQRGGAGQRRWRPGRSRPLSTPPLARAGHAISKGTTASSMRASTRSLARARARDPAQRAPSPLPQRPPWP